MISVMLMVSKVFQMDLFNLKYLLPLLKTSFNNMWLTYEFDADIISENVTLKMENEANSNHCDTQTSDSDYDVSNEESLEKIFDKSCTLLTSINVCNDNKYLLYLHSSSETENTIIAASPSSVDILKLGPSQVAKSTEISFEGTCVGVKFAPNDTNQVYVACHDSRIQLFDLRTPAKAVKEFVDSTEHDCSESKTFLCFDVAPDNSLLTAGCELFDCEAFVLFWDVRTTNLMGGYWESHTDDVIQLKFHPDHKHKLLSASTDGLINMYNLEEDTEDDALTECLNTESSVEQIGWCNDNVFCATHTHDVQLWRLQDATPFGDYKRAALSSAIKRKSDDYSYVAGCFQDNNRNILMIGSNYKDGRCLRALNAKQSTLDPLFDCKDNRQRVRTLFYDERKQFLFTGGENGALDVWKLSL